MQRRKWILIAALGVLLLTILAWRLGRWQSDLLQQAEGKDGPQRRYSELTIGEQSYEVVLSETQAEITQGLSRRQTIGAAGMLFLLPQKQQVSFWMYQMYFPLDFVWIADGRVVDLHENVQTVPFTTPERDIPVVTPDQPVEMVLEVPGGFVQENGIVEGLAVDLDESREVKGW